MLKRVEPLFPRFTRQRAIDKAVAFVDERLNGEDGLGAIFPAMVNAVLMYDVLGVPADDPRVVMARESIEGLLVVKDDEAYCQPCLSPIWDTALAAHALLEVGARRRPRTAATQALDWLKPKQVLDVAGDWAAQRPDVRPGGWAFQYANPHYPDLDDTAVVVMAMDRAARSADRDARPTTTSAIARGREWVVGLQSKDGGWAAFDADNTHHYLNNIPFADHGALLDPPTADLTARCVSMLAQLDEEAPTSPALSRGVAWLMQDQHRGRQLVRALGHELHLRHLVGALRAERRRRRPAVADASARPSTGSARIQNADGGWGEDGDELQARLPRLRAGAEHAVADRLGAARA